MLKSLQLLALLLVLSTSLPAQEPKTRNLIVVTLDGLRWREVFEGADRKVISNPKYVKDTTVSSLFDGGSALEDREKLMPFFWTVIAKEGQLYGNRHYKNKVNCTNNHLLSYPGYSEMFVGYPERSVSSNDRTVNPNATVFEFINGHDEFRNKVAAFTTWDLFPFILREEKSRIYVNSGKDLAEGTLTAKERRVNESLTSEKRSDRHTFDLAFEYLKKEHPRVLFIGFDGTDHTAHHGQYDEYLKSANSNDAMIAELWQWVQTHPDYADQTTLLLTTDHGRGNGKNNWKDHYLLGPGSRHIWFAVLGPDTPAFGELKFKGKYFQKQVAQTIAAFLGLEYQSKQPAGEVVQTMIAVPQSIDQSLTSKRTGPIHGGE